MSCFLYLTKYLPERAGAGSPGGKSRARASTALAVALLLGSLVAASGCGSANAQVQSYLDAVRPAFNTFNAKLDALKGFWSVPLAEQAGLKQALADFRKATSDARTKLDTSHAPTECRDFDRLLVDCLANAKGTADAWAPFADYLGDLAPQASAINDVVTGISNIKTAHGVATQLLQLNSKVSSVNGALKAVIAPSEFAGVNKEFTNFVNYTAANLTEASKAIGGTSSTPSSDSTNQRDNTNQDYTAPSEPSDAQNSAQGKAAWSVLQGVPQEWENVKGRIFDQTGSLRDSTGLNLEINKIDTLMASLKAQMAKLEKDFNAAPPK